MHVHAGSNSSLLCHLFSDLLYQAWALHRSHPPCESHYSLCEWRECKVWVCGDSVWRDGKCLGVLRQYVEGWTMQA